MSLSSFCVVTNALRLNLFDPYKVGPNEQADQAPPLIKHDMAKAKPTELAQPSPRQIDVQIKGMICNHCAKRIQQALAALNVVNNVTVDYSAGIAQIAVDEHVDLENLKTLLSQAVTQAGYEYLGIKEESMEKCLKVEGMMCAHCEKHVCEALEKIDGVTKVAADHTKNQVLVTMSKDVPEELFQGAVTTAGYTYKGCM